MTAYTRSQLEQARRVIDSRIARHNELTVQGAHAALELQALLSRAAADEHISWDQARGEIGAEIVQIDGQVTARLSRNTWRALLPVESCSSGWRLGEYQGSVLARTGWHRCASQDAWDALSGLAFGERLSTWIAQADQTGENAAARSSLVGAALPTLRLPNDAVDQALLGTGAVTAPEDLRRWRQSRAGQLTVVSSVQAGTGLGLSELLHLSSGAGTGLLIGLGVHVGLQALRIAQGHNGAGERRRARAQVAQAWREQLEQHQGLGGRALRLASVGLTSGGRRHAVPDLEWAQRPELRRAPRQKPPSRAALKAQMEAQVVHELMTGEGESGSQPGGQSGGAPSETRHPEQIRSEVLSALSLESARALRELEAEAREFGLDGEARALAERNEQAAALLRERDARQARLRALEVELQVARERAQACEGEERAN